MNDEIERLNQLVGEYSSKLAEHCDSVRIFVTKHGDGSLSNSVSINEGRGNYYAQYGQVKEWVVIQEEDARCKARGDHGKEDE